MKHQVRRDAGHHTEAAWWLLPIVLATAALAAVAWTPSDTGGPAARAPVLSVTSMPNVAPVAATVAPVTVQPASAQPEEPLFEERVPTF